jgi:hypothetical protein
MINRRCTCSKSAANTLLQVETLRFRPLQPLLRKPSLPCFANQAFIGSKLQRKSGNFESAPPQAGLEGKLAGVVGRYRAAGSGSVGGGCCPSLKLASSRRC